ncbi:WcaI family glycosyltransferase [Mucilaginibacter sp.]|uniref:WcaI family glycosyltransferase n=1 Tax=Mucilaginibacter sp. TaxID=1882438 RepID=UPI003D0FF733
MSNKSILLISHNFYPEPTGIGKYNGEMMNWLAANGNDCTVITTFPYYPHWKVQAPYKNVWYKKEKKNVGSGSLTVYRCPLYVPANPTGKKRILQDFSFWVSMIWIVFKFILSGKKFDLIITIAPPFHLAYLGTMLKKFTGGKLLYHVQDLQIEAAQDLNMLSSDKLFSRLYKIEKNILNKADFISSISEGMIGKIEAKAGRDVFFFPNWVEVNQFYPITEREQLKIKWGYKADDIIFQYSGAIGEKQGLEAILQAAESLADKKNIKFIICGSGPYKEKLINIVTEKKLENVFFLPVQDKEVFNEFLNLADIHLILQKHSASDLVMPSKLTTILAVGGVSIITAPKDTSLYNLTKKYNIGYLVEPENGPLLLQAILDIQADNTIEQKRKNARQYAIDYLNIDNIMKDFTCNFLN